MRASTCVGQTAGVLTALTVVMSCALPESPDRDAVVVSAAVSLSEVLREVAEAYQQATGTHVLLNLAGSDTLATQLIAGAPVDLFVSADQAQMDRVAGQHRILPETRVDLLANQLAIVVPVDRVDRVRTIEDLRLPSVRRIAIGDPDAVPAGVYAREHLASIGLWDDVQAKMVPTRSVRAVVAVVEAGHADAGVVYRTDITGAAGVRMAVAIPVEDGPTIRYPAAVVTGAANEETARHLLRYLQGPEARRVFDQAGFTLLETSR